MNQQTTFGSASRPIIPAGTQLNGIYEIDEPIAAGGMGEIYKGHAIQTGDPVAIKLIRSDLAESEAAFALFRKEASALHNLYHEAIVRYYVFTIDPILERPYLAMEFVDGKSLSAMLRGGPLAYEAVHRLMQRIASGLHAAHERGIVHRDVSPDNIIIPGGDMARGKIIDFGIARSTRLGDAGTVIGSGFAGKYGYVSPEQLGLYGGEVDGRSDIYSLGLVLAEALRGEPVDMGGSHVEVIEKRRVVPDLGKIDQRLRPLIEKMLQPLPADRPQSMAEVATWTNDAPSQKTTRTRPGSGTRKLESRQGSTARPGGKGVWIGGGATAVLAIGAGLTFFLLRAPATPPVPPTPTLTVEKNIQKADKSAASLSSAEPTDNVQVRPGLAPMNMGKLSGDAKMTDIASLLPGQAPVDPRRHDRIDALTRYINQYDGGDCFFVKPVAVNDKAAAIEGFGSSQAPFQVLDDAFRRSNGFEADIGVRQVSAGQCPAITFLSRLRTYAAQPPNLDLSSLHLKPGETIRGSVSGLDGRQVDVLIVGDDGAIRVVPTPPPRSEDDGVSFAMRLPNDLNTGKTQLLLVVVSAKPLTSLRNTRPTSADKLFPQILAEADRTGQGIGAMAKTFKIER